MRIQDISLSHWQDDSILSARLSTTAAFPSGDTVWFRFPRDAGGILENPGNVFFCAFLIPCMQAGEDLEIAGPTDLSLLRALPRIQDRLTEWYPGFHRSRVRTRAAGSTPVHDGRTAACFSGGVDSLYTALDPPGTVNTLVLARGFENPADDDARQDATLSVAGDMASGLGLPLVTVGTNLRSLGDRQFARRGRRFRGTFFGRCWMGSFLAALGHCLSGRHNRFVIPSTLAPSDRIPYGSRPDLDPLWSTPRMQVCHHGGECSRLFKVRRIAQGVRLPDLRLQVCESNAPGEVNCGHCDKCLRSRLALRLAGIGDDLPDFPGAPRWERWPLVADPRRFGSEYRELAAACRESREPALADILDAILSPPPWWRGLRRRVRSGLRSAVWRRYPFLAARLRGRRRRVWGREPLPIPLSRE